MKTIKRFFRSTIVGIFNIITWLPVVWEDRQFDFAYIFDILQFKLRLMEEYFRNANIIEDSEKIADSIKECKIILDRIQKNDYLPNDILEWPMTEENRKKIIEAGQKEEIEYSADISRFFTKMAKEIQNWWD